MLGQNFYLKCSLNKAIKPLKDEPFRGFLYEDEILFALTLVKKGYWEKSIYMTNIVYRLIREVIRNWSQIHSDFRAKHYDLTEDESSDILEEIKKLKIELENLDEQSTETKRHSIIT
ncbi:hypothetical protein IC620_15245 [Hazenella sp. IB182357]|uniref:Uncharacterized protein n=1 Tax=Polycladospora coralii TaxID=2771432 RepID=A0A926NE22_9BACL|nr:hypothetical protein [Polycladospora coralii]